MADYYYHYTSRKAAQEILCCKRIKPGVTGKIYLSRDFYRSGQEAMDALAIEGKALEIVFLISAANVTIADPVQNENPMHDGFGRIVRHGGGSMVYTTQELPLSSGSKHIALYWP